MPHTVRFVRGVALLALPAALLLSGAPAADADGSPLSSVVVSGLRNPRGIAVSADGKLYVAESGEAGPVCFPGIPTEEGGTLCGGLSGRISRIDTRTGARSDYIDDLVSVGGALFAIGPTGVAIQGNQVSGLLGANDVAVPPADACGGGPDCQAFVDAATAQLGHLLRGVPSGGWSWQQDLGGFNYGWTVANKDTIGAGDPSYQPGWADNPDFEPGDANPYGMASAPGGSYTVDGGANTLTWVPRQGSPRVVAAFPNPDPAHANAYDSVPTCVTTTGGGKVFVADLNGQVFVLDGSSLTVHPSAVTSRHGAFLVAAGGCASDDEGNVYISDIFAGSVVKVAVGSMTMSWVRAPGTFNFPAGVAVADDVLYVVNNSVCPSFLTPPAPDNPCSNVTGSVVGIGL